MRIIVKMAVIAVLTATMSGCWFEHFIVKDGDAFDTKTDPKCYQACTEQSYPITANPDSGIDSKKYEHELRKACEERRLACVAGINRGKDAGKIK